MLGGRLEQVESVDDERAWLIIRGAGGDVRQGAPTVFAVIGAVVVFVLASRADDRPDSCDLGSLVDF